MFHYRILMGLQTISWIVKREGCVTVTLNLVARATFDIKLAFTTGPQIKKSGQKCINVLTWICYLCSWTGTFLKLHLCQTESTFIQKGHYSKLSVDGSLLQKGQVKFFFGLCLMAKLFFVLVVFRFRKRRLKYCLWP